VFEFKVVVVFSRYKAARESGVVLDAARAAVVILDFDVYNIIVECN
jgi:hypothetical protein